MTQLMEYVKMALKNIWANKVRTLLTMLGIIIGISSVILIVAVGNGAAEMITKSLGKLGSGQVEFYTMSDEEKYCITDEDINAVSEIEGVKAVATQIIISGDCRARGNDYSATVAGINYEGIGMLEYEMVRGGWYSKYDDADGKNYCVIKQKDAIKMFGSDNVVGMDIDVCLYGKYEATLTIAGVAVTDKDDNMVSSLYADPTVEIIMPQKTIENTTGHSFTDTIADFYILRDTSYDSEKVCKAVIDYLETAHYCKGKEIYTYYSFDDVMKSVNSAINLITVFVSFVASVSLVVGGIGVMNIMLVSVTERTREIGIRKALGAKTGSITVQFLAESAFITLIGGLIGILLGVLGAYLITAIIGSIVPTMKFTPALSFKAVMIASLFSTSVGLFFGIYPARKAAKLSPIEALRQN